MYSSAVYVWNGCAAYSSASLVPRIICIWCILSMSSFVADISGACLRLSSSSSPGSPMMMCPPVVMPRPAVRSIVRHAHSKVCPRFMRRSVSSFADSIPYSTIMNVWRLRPSR